MIDALHRVTYRWGYRAARILWSVTGPSVHGALVAVRQKDRILLIRNSYRKEWTLPGGGIKPGEAARTAGLRELREEIGLRACERDLVELGSVAMLWHGRRDHVTFFALEVASLPQLTLDNREVVEARLVSFDAASSEFLLQPHVEQLVARRCRPLPHP